MRDDMEIYRAYLAVRSCAEALLVAHWSDNRHAKAIHQHDAEKSLKEAAARLGIELRETEDAA